MGRRFEEFKSRMRSQAQIDEIEAEISDHENYIAANGDGSTTPMRLLRSAVAAMRGNLSELRRLHSNRFGRRFTR